MQNKNPSKEIKIITIFAVVTALFVILINMVSLYHINTLHIVTENIYNHPLKVSNAAINVQKDVLKIHRDMKDVVLLSHASKLQNLILKVDKEEQNVYSYLEIIEKNILGNEGKKLYKETYELFKAWKNIRDRVIQLVKDKQFATAIEITQNEGAMHVQKLEKSAMKLNRYAHTKADKFKNYAHTTFQNFKLINIVLTILTLSLFILFTLYVKRRIQNYIHSIQELNERFELAIGGSNDGLWDWNIKENTIYFSPRWKEMLGYRDDELKNEFATWEERVHPDDLEKANKKITLAQSDPSVEYNTIHRLRHKDGSWVWVLDRGQTIFDDNKQAIRMTGFHTDITQQKLLEEKLTKLKQQFEQFMEFMPANIIIKENDIVVYANSSSNDFFHCDTIVGKTIENLFPKHKLKQLRSFEKKAYSRGFYEEILEIKNSENEESIYRNMAFIIKGKEKKRLGIVSIDITKEYHANREITRVLSAFERSNISIIITDVLGNIQYVNPSWCSLTGYTKEELLGQNPRIVKSGYISRETYEKMWKELTNGRVWNSEIKNRAKDGSEFWEDSTIMPSFNSEGIIDGYIAFKLEISDKIRLREELKDKEELMIAQSRHAAMGEMISMIAHQWRQPISVIAMDANNVLVDIELDSVENNSLKTDINDIIDQTKYLSQTIDDFRNFFKPTKLKDEVLISELFKEALSVMIKSLENHNIEVLNNFKTQTKVFIFSRELLQVIINILKNAKEALEESREEQRKIINEIYENDDFIIISICDNAGGIDNNIIPHIFNPYFTSKDAKNGTGLGLYMSKTIIEKHLRGNIRAYNKNDGACFEIYIPKLGEE